MHFLLTYRRFLSVALFAMGAGVAVAQTAPDAKSAAAAARESMQKGPSSAADLQKLIEQINSQREKLIVDHEALARQLKEATDDSRKVILEKMREQKKAFEEAQSSLHKQIRDEQRRQRQSVGSGKR